MRNTIDYRALEIISVIFPLTGQTVKAYVLERTKHGLRVETLDDGEQPESARGAVFYAK